MSTIEHAIAFAATSHKGQLDKVGAPYIFHPLRIMLRLEGEEEKMAAVLHDVIEDCSCSLDQLRAEGFSEKVVEAVNALTRRPDESYEQFVRRAAVNPIARRVKMEDLRDNCDLSRIANPTDRDYKRIEKYRRAIAILESVDTQ